MTSEEQQERWHQQWATGVYENWHRTQKNTELWKFLPLLCPDTNDKSGLFFVPMSGKCLDLKFLYEEGFNVLGAELFEEVVQDFFRENSLPYEVEEVKGGHRVYSTADQKLRIVCGDILTLSKDTLAGEMTISMVWDRGALGSIAKNLRKSYARVLKDLLAGSRVRYLLDCWQYREWYRAHPPHDCPLGLIQDLLGDCFQIQELQRTEPDPGVLPHYGDPHAKKVVYLLSSK